LFSRNGSTKGQDLQDREGMSGEDPAVRLYATVSRAFDRFRTFQ
jgi:hypothetical protein